MSTSPLDEDSRPGMVTIRRLAAELGMSPENIRALERRGRLPDGCEPQVDELTGTRYWTAGQVRRLREWNDERRRARAEAGAGPEAGPGSPGGGLLEGEGGRQVASGQRRDEVRVGARVSIVEKHNQPTGITTEGVVRELLTRSAFHPHGIKVRLEGGQVGRVKEILL